MARRLGGSGTVELALSWFGPERCMFGSDRPVSTLVVPHKSRYGFEIVGGVAYSSLPEPILARSGRLPMLGGYAHVVKWDGLRATVSRARLEA